MVELIVHCEFNHFENVLHFHIIRIFKSRLLKYTIFKKTIATLTAKLPYVDQNKLYWRTNLKYLGILLSIWFVISFGCGILFADQLNNYHVGGFPLGFWFAQQGAIYVFVILIFVYVYLMNRLDHKYDVEED